MYSNTDTVLGAAHWPCGSGGGGGGSGRVVTFQFNG